MDRLSGHCPMLTDSSLGINIKTSPSVFKGIALGHTSFMNQGDKDGQIGSTPKELRERALESEEPGIEAR